MEKVWVKNYPKGVPVSLRFEDISLVAALKRTAGRYPDNKALLFQGTTWTYRELDQAVSRFTSALRELKVRPGDRVSIVLPNIIQTVVAIYGALGAGAVVVMHNPRNDDMQLQYQLSNAGSTVLICLDVLVPRMQSLKPRTGLKKIVSCHIRDYLPFLSKTLFPLVKKDLHLKTSGSSDVLEFTEMLEGAVTATRIQQAAMEETAFVLYTSATTGKSKGVELTHGNVSRNVQQLHAWFPSFKDGQEIVVACLPFFHVFGLTCALNIGIYYGYAVTLVPLPEPKNILEAIDQSGATFIPALPGVYSAVVNDPALKKYKLQSLKGCFSGGAPLPLETIREFENLTGAQICEGYGLTETSPVTHVNPWGGKTKVGTIGLPIPDTDAKIVDVDDPDTEVTTAGVPGELCIRGPQVMKCYSGLPEQTAATLKDGWLLTGDLAMVDSDGYFTIVDRKKDLIVSDGAKIYPRDVDEVLFTHPKVAEGCAIGVPHQEQGQIVKAFVVLKKGQTATAGEIIDFCRTRLPSYKVPRQVDFLDELPRSPVGKILRKELRRMHLVRSGGGPLPSGSRTSG
jgi:long-chain acyl-CoA synthetase